MSSRLLSAVGLLLLVCVATRLLVAQQKLRTSELFSVYRGVLEVAPLPKAEWETLEPRMRTEGFTTTDRIFWRLRDSSGTLIITAFPDNGHFSLRYFPSTSAPFGDAALAALINKAESVSLGDGDTLSIHLRSSNRTNKGRTANVTEYLTFNLRGGAWQETTVYIEWSK